MLYELYTIYIQDTDINDQELETQRWKHKGLKQFFEIGSIARIQVNHRKALNEILFQLDHATCPTDMNIPGNDFHKLSGKRNGQFSVSVNENWRVVFAFEQEDAILVDYLDYH